MKEEKLGKSDYEMKPANEIKVLTSSWSIFWYDIKQWFLDNLEKLFDWFIRLIIFSLISLMLFGMHKCVRHDAELRKQQEIEWTTGDSTFVKKQDGYYIYRREIEGHKYYLYKHKNEYGDLINDQYVPVNSCIDEP